MVLRGYFAINTECVQYDPMFMGVFNALKEVKNVFHFFDKSLFYVLGYCIAT